MFLLHCRRIQSDLVVFLYQLEAKKSDSDSVHGRFPWASLTGGMHELFPTDSQFNFQPPEDTSASLTQLTRPGDQKQTKKNSRVHSPASSDLFRFS